MDETKYTFKDDEDQQSDIIYDNPKFSDSVNHIHPLLESGGIERYNEFVNSRQLDFDGRFSTKQQRYLLLLKYSSVKYINKSDIVKDDDYDSIRVKPSGSSDILYGFRFSSPVKNFRFSKKTKHQKEVEYFNLSNESMSEVSFPKPIHIDLLRRGGISINFIFDVDDDNIRTDDIIITEVVAIVSQIIRSGSENVRSLGDEALSELMKYVTLS